MQYSEWVTSRAKEEADASAGAAGEDMWDEWMSRLRKGANGVFLQWQIAKARGCNAAAVR